MNFNGIRRGETIFVGDAKVDFDAAFCNGLKFIGRISNEEINPFVKIKSPYEIPIINDLNQLQDAINQIEFDNG